MGKLLLDGKLKKIYGTDWGKQNGSLPKT